MEESDITEIEIKEGEEAVRISRAPAGRVPDVAQVPAQTATALESKPTEAIKGHIIHAPMVGTFYRAASPGSPPFVDIGTRIKEGETLCIIESMKMMNQIKADKSGTIEAILAENDTPVEFDQPLFTVS